MRLYEDDSEEIRPSFSIGDEKKNGQGFTVTERETSEYYEERGTGQFDPVARVQTKLNIVSVMIPCIVAIAIVMMYFHIKREMTVIQDSGSTELKNISLELQQKVTNIENRIAAIEQKINTDFAAANESIKATGAKIEQISQTTQGKADKKDFEAFNINASARLEQIQKSASETAVSTADRIRKDIDTNIAQMQKSVDSAVKSAGDLEKSIKPEIEALKESVSEAAGIAKAAQKEAAGLKAADFATPDDIKTESSRLESKIKELEQKISTQSKASAAAAAKASKSSAASAKEAPSSKGKAAAVKPVPESGVHEDDFEEPPLDTEELPAAKSNIKPKPVTSPASKPSKTRGGINEQDF